MRAKRKCEGCGTNYAIHALYFEKGKEMCRKCHKKREIKEMEED